jgi:zinc protease
MKTNQQSIGCNASFSCFAQQMDYSKAIPFDSTVKNRQAKTYLTYYIKKNAKPERK